MVVPFLTGSFTDASGNAEASAVAEVEQFRGSHRTKVFTAICNVYASQLAMDGDYQPIATVQVTIAGTAFIALYEGTLSGPAGTGIEEAILTALQGQHPYSAWSLQTETDADPVG